MRQGSALPCILLCLFMAVMLLTVGRPSSETSKNERFYNLVMCVTWLSCASNILYCVLLQRGVSGLKITAGCWPVKMTGQTKFYLGHTLFLTGQI